MCNLPIEFVERMKKQLPENEWEAFFACYENKHFKGVRVNPLKGERNALKEKIAFVGKPVPWEENGFYTDEEKPGQSPYHAAGVFYSQEPSAMCVAPLLDVQSGERVLDLCSAPGGKGTQLACKTDGKGLIVLNEPVFARAKILSQNVERLGIKNAVVVSELPENLSVKFVEYFDKILVDAPCSGEGMFRKNAEEALGEWSVENVRLCAERQRRILDEATKMLRVGGKMVYSTCTFANEEDEGQVCDYLQRHSEMRLLKQEKLYPHKVEGEGHFAALFEKTSSTEGDALRVKDGKPRIGQEAKKAYETFEKQFFFEKFATRLHEAGGVLYDLPEDVFDWKGLQVLRVGIRLGEVKNGRFEPSHSLAMAVSANACKNTVDLSADDEAVKKYFRGETLSVPEVQNGWCLVCMDGFPIGLGKAVNGTMKNHYPKGLRN